MEILVHMPDGEIVTVEVDDDRFEQARRVFEAQGQTFEEAFTEYLREFLCRASDHRARPTEHPMKVTLESTTKIVMLDSGFGVDMPARIWEGTTESGIPVHAYITRIAVSKTDDATQFERELQECRPPTAAIAAIPLRLIL